MAKWRITDAFEDRRGALGAAKDYRNYVNAGLKLGYLKIVPDKKLKFKKL